MSNTIVTFERAFVKLAGDLAVDGYRSPSGEFRVGMASASVAVGYEKNWIGRVTSKQCQTSKELSSMGYSFETIEGIVIGSTGSQKIKTISIKDFTILVDYGVREGKENALRLKGIPVKAGYTKKSKESIIRDDLATKLGGKIEILCPAGRIDVLTDKEIIEVKESKNWKEAIGQIICYGFYFPDRVKRIHLFGPVDANMKEIILEHSRELNIYVSWEK